MDSAQDRYGKVIYAERATRGARYQCPECKNRVQFIPSGHQTAHFRHVPASTLYGSDRQRCERCSRYIADHGGGLHGQPPATIPVRPPARATLAVGWKLTAGEPERWALYVSVPIPPAGVELVWVEGNINGEVWIPRSSVAKHRLIPVRAAAKQYQVRYRSHPDGVSLRTIPVVNPTDPLDGNFTNVFAAGVGGGAQLEPGKPLVRGRCYFTLSKVPEVWSPSPGDTSRALSGSKDSDQNGAWEGHLLYVPLAPDPVFARWSERVCERRVVAPSADLVLVYPPMTSTRPDGTVIVPAGEDVILAPQGDWDEPEVEVWRDDVTATPVVERLSVSSGEQIVLRGLVEGIYSVYVTESDRASLRIEVADAVAPKVSDFSIRTEHRDTGKELRGSLHGPEGSKRWAGLMSGSEGWVGVDFPAGLPVEFRYRLRGENRVHRKSATLPSEVSEMVGICLAAEPLFAEIDAGAFGSAVWIAPAPVKSSGPARKPIPQAVRQRLEWLIAAASRISCGARTLPVGVSVIPDWMSQVSSEDFSTVSKFFSARRWPEPFVAHARAAAKDLSYHLRT